MRGYLSSQHFPRGLMEVFVVGVILHVSFPTGEQQLALPAVQILLPENKILTQKGPQFRLDIHLTSRIVGLGLAQLPDRDGIGLIDHYVFPYVIQFQGEGLTDPEPGQDEEIGKVIPHRHHRVQQHTQLFRLQILILDTFFSVIRQKGQSIGQVVLDQFILVAPSQERLESPHPLVVGVVLFGDT